MKKKVTAIFDIGKTNKKFFLFDTSFREVHREYIRIDPIEDEDGIPSEDLQVLESWMKDTLDKHLESSEFEIEQVNFSSYGASLVHLDKTARPCAPLYNYTKPIDPGLVDEFYQKYGPENEFSRVTGTTNAGMLNSGMQLFLLKHQKPAVFKNIQYTLHLPQYLSFLFTGKMFCEYTSIGCHTALWDYKKRDYHSWVRQEGIDKLFPSLVTTDNVTSIRIRGKSIRCGIGIHDSSSALIPYLQSIRKKFILLSTGTWSIALNPFTEGMLTEGDLKEGNINYMQTNGHPVKASSLFLGNEYKFQVEGLTRLFNVPADRHKSLKFNISIYNRIKRDFRPMFCWKSFSVPGGISKTRVTHETFEGACHQLNYELAQLQSARIKQLTPDSSIKQLYIDGGFGDNELFVEMLARSLPGFRVRTTKSSLGSALGAAVVLSGKKLSDGFLKENYQMKKIKPLITS